jgi:hypothetical protein
MSVVTLGNGQTVRLGRKTPVARPQCPRFAAYFNPAEMKVAVPAAVDYYSKATASIKRMYLNDRYGDCVIAGKAHQLGIWSANDSDSPGVILATDQEIYNQYVNICGPNDEGCFIPDVLNYFKSKGLVAGGKAYKIDGYVEVDWTNKLEVQVAIFLFGSLTLGINLPSAWASGGDGSTWDVTNSSIIGGHDVCCVGYNEKGVQISTWGGIRTITWGAFTSKRWLEECYCELSPNWYGNDKMAPCGFDAKTLADDLAKLGGGVIPPLDPPVPVPPVPVPPAPVPVPPVPPVVPPVPPAPVPVPVTVSVVGYTAPVELTVGWRTYTIPGQKIVSTGTVTLPAKETEMNGVLTDLLLKKLLDLFTKPDSKATGTFIDLITQLLSNPQFQQAILALLMKLLSGGASDKMAGPFVDILTQLLSNPQVQAALLALLMKLLSGGK